MIVVDASVLIAYLDPYDAHHSAAVELLANATPPLLLHPVTAAEVLVAPVRRRVAESVWADLVAIGVEVDHSPIDPLQLAQLRVETGCKMPDCCVLAVAAARAAAVVTFDERLARHTSPT
ncbi:MAG: PIN domain-containing protein [Actinomycetota bacterium]|nr:PIN domain-containing protein [Actinomycetota bacterium]